VPAQIENPSRSCPDGDEVDVGIASGNDRQALDIGVMSQLSGEDRFPLGYLALDLAGGAGS
jgi:hypothetical protein